MASFRRAGEFRVTWEVSPLKNLHSNSTSNQLDAGSSAADPLITLLLVVQWLPMALRINPVCSYRLLGLHGLVFVVFCLDSFCAFTP